MTEDPIEILLGRLHNWKFQQALDHANNSLSLLDSQKEILEALATLWGDTGWCNGGSLGSLIGYAVECLIAEIAIDAQKSEEE